jgi:hypothetical protein
MLMAQNIPSQDGELVATPRTTSELSNAPQNTGELIATPRNKGELVATPRNSTAPVTQVTPVDRPSNPIKQGIAGVTDVFTSLPAFAGLIGSGAEAAYNYATDGTDKGLTEQFDEAIKTGTDADLINMTHTARNFVNDSLNIKNPISTEDQAARIFGAFMVPIPGSSSVSALNKAASFVLPLVRTGAGFGKRVAQQAVIGGTLGTAMDQGIRAMTDHPLMFSEQALTGKLPEAIVTPTVLTATPRNEEGAHKLREVDELVQNEQDKQESVKWAASGALLLGAAILARRPITSAIQKVRKPAELGNELHADYMDATTAIEIGLDSLGTSQQSINRTIHNSRTDPTDMAFNWLEEAQLGQDFAFPARLTPIPYDKLNQKFLALTPDQQKVFNDAMTASVDKMERARGKATDLWAGGRKADNELDPLINAGIADNEVRGLMNAMGQQYELMLRYQVHRGTMTKATASRLMNQSRVNGHVRYMPIYKSDPRGFFERLANKYLGYGGRTQRESAFLAEFAPSDPISKGAHLNPLEAYRKYAIHTIADANEQSFKANLFDRLSGITRDLRGNPSQYTPTTRTALDTTFIGHADDLSNPQSLTINKLGHPNKQFHGKTLGDLEKEFPGEIVTARYNDQVRVYHVPHKGLRAAAELSPRLNNILSVASAWKNLFTRSTTGNLSLFAPFSHAFSAQQTALNTSARYGLWAGIKSVGEGLKGTGQMMAVDGAKNISTFLGQRIARHMRGTGQTADMAAPMMAGLQRRLDARIKHSMLNQIRRESGRTQAGIGNIGNGTMEEIMNAVGRNSSDYFGKDQMGLVGNLWNTWNNAWHEGPAYGAMLRHIGEARNAGQQITPQVIRDAADISKSIAGDMRRRGASNFAEAFNASVPFSAAMLQSWNAIGSAAKHDFGKFMLGASALIGVPTLSELAWNKSVGADGKVWTDDGGQQWTVDDYLWNAYTTQQRVDNFIYMVPGKPPWEAILVPVSPEWSLFRGVVLEAADAIFSLSTIGNMENIDQDKTNRSHFWTSLARVTDVALPPVISAGLSAVGADVQLGLRSGVNNAAGEAPSEQMSFIKNIPVGQGDRYGRATKFDSGHLDETTTAIIQDIFGAAGAAYINVHEAFMTGLTRKDGSVTEAVDRSLEAFGGALKSQARYTQPLMGKVLHPNASGDEITKSYISTKKAMQNLAKQVDSDYMRGGMMYADGQLVSGDTIILRDDPINLELAVYAENLLSMTSTLDQQINQIHSDIKSIPNDRKIGSLKARNDKRDALTMELQTKRAQVLNLAYDAEYIISQALSNKYRRDIKVRFSEFTPRAQLPTSSIFQELQKPLQTSQ